MVQKIRERRAEWEVRNAARQRSRYPEMCSKQAGRAAGSLDWRGREEGGGECRIEFERAIQHPDLC